MRVLRTVLVLLLLGSPAAYPAPPTSLPASKVAPAVLPLRILLPQIRPNLSLSELQAILGAPNQKYLITDSDGWRLWMYRALDGILEVTVAPTEGQVKAIDARPSMVLARHYVHLGDTPAYVNAALTAALLAQKTDWLMTYFSGDSSHGPTHQLIASNGTLYVWTNPHTVRIRRITKSRQTQAP